MYTDDEDVNNSSTTATSTGTSTGTGTGTGTGTTGAAGTAAGTSGTAVGGSERGEDDDDELNLLNEDDVAKLGLMTVTLQQQKGLSLCLSVCVYLSLCLSVCVWVCNNVFLLGLVPSFFPSYLQTGFLSPSPSSTFPRHFRHFQTTFIHISPSSNLTNQKVSIIS